MTETRGDYKTRFKKYYSEEIAATPVSVRLPVALDQQVRSLPDKTKWLREAIAEKMEREKH